MQDSLFVEPRQGNTSILFVGGTRSGKSALALRWAQAQVVAKPQAKKVFIATSRAEDAEMQDRIALHKAERGMTWQSVDVPLLDIAVLENIQKTADILIIDCLSLWLSNAMHAVDDDAALLERMQSLVGFVQRSTVPMALVTSEVGQGIVPMHALARRYRDMHGLLNQHVAAVCSNVLLVSCALPLALKGMVPSELL